ncbi:MAG: hypothetical protein ACOYMQ_04150 [Pseudanabaena sp.]
MTMLCAIAQFEQSLKGSYIKPASWDISDLIEPLMGINLLQHPEGELMKL